MKDEILLNESKKAEKDEISLRDLIIKISSFFRYVLSRWRFLLIFFIIGGALGTIFGIFNKPIYTATTTFVLEEGEKSGGLGQYAGIASMVGLDLGSSGGGGIFQGDNIIELYKSRTMIEKTLLTEVTYNGKRELLINHYIDFKKLREKWAKNSELRHLNFSVTDSINSTGDGRSTTRLKDSVLSLICLDINKNYLSVTKPDKKLSIINTEVKSPDEFFAKAFNENIVENVNDFYIQTKTKKSLKNVSILQNKADSVRALMNGAIYSAASVTDATPNLNPTKQLQRNAPVQRSQMSMEINKTILGELVKNLELSKISLTKETPLIQVIDRPIFPLEKTKSNVLLLTALGGFIFLVISILVLAFNKLLDSE